jgi:N-formylglutamate deformylase
METVELVQGTSPVILGLPHTGTHVPPEIWARLNESGRLLADTDWHIHRLYEGLLPGATTVRALFHRYVIDGNRDPQDTSLYPGQNTTGLVPLTDFDGEPIWQSEPDSQEIAGRLAQFHAHYHTALAAEIERVKAIHGIAILYDCHSIRSRIPYLFEGVLPDFNVGTNEGKSCAREIEEIVFGHAAASGRTHVLNGRFKGGWTTRHYGRPADGVHAIQMELAQSTHLASEAPPFAYDAAKADGLRETLAAMLVALDKWGRANARA